MNKKYNLLLLVTLFILSTAVKAQNNPDFFVDNGTCKCPDANFGDTGTVTINGQQKIFTKRNRSQLDAIIANDEQDPEIALTCTSGITDMNGLFSNEQNFNQNINHWDVSQVTTMRFLFLNATSFNQPLNNWDVSQVTQMRSVFNNAESFNQHLNNWDVSQVTTMDDMFAFADSFNQPINSWNVSQVTNMSDMFRNADSFNQPLDNWNVLNTFMLKMFTNAYSFNQDLSYWCVSNKTSEPTDFSLGAPLTNDNKPVWGTCPEKPFYLDTNGVTIKLKTGYPEGTTGPADGDISGTTYTAVDNASLNNIDFASNPTGDYNKYCTTLVNEMASLFLDTSFNGDISAWDLSGVSSMFSMFENSPFNGDVSNWDVSNVTNMGNLFRNSNFNGDVSQWNVSNVTTMSALFFQSDFNGDVSQWDVGNVVVMASLFRDTPFNGDVSNWNVSSAKNMFSTFRNSNFSGDISDWDVSNVTNMVNLFRNSNFNGDVSNWNVSGVTDMKNMFRSSPFNGNVSNWDVGIVTDMFAMFYQSDFSGDVSQWDVSNVTRFQSIFRETNFNGNISNWDVSSATNMAFMFDNSAFNGDINGWDVSNVTNMYAMFRSSDFNQPLNDWDVSSVTNMVDIFNNSPFNQPLNDWDVSSVTNMFAMFRNSDFNQTLNDWDVSNVIDMDNMFQDAINFNQDISSWCVTNITTEPSNFSVNSPLTNNNKPLWGDSCLITTWTASNAWDNGIPNSNDRAIVAADYSSSSSIRSKELTVNTGKTLAIKDGLSVKNELINNGDIVFKSDSNGTGQLDRFTGNITGNGTISVERYIPVQAKDTRAFRFLTSTVNSTQPIYDNWQESGSSPAGFGTHITGNNNNQNGLDQTVSGNYSMYTFDNSFQGNQSNAWNPVTNTKNTNLTAGKAYRIFIRGDRNYDLDSSNPVDPPNTNVTLRASGNLITGDYTVSLNTKAGYYSMIGNPYQANVNINDVTGVNMNTNFYYVWDPNRGQRGAYVTVSLPQGTNSGTSDADEYLQPGQSFFVKTSNNGSASMTFSESSKALSAAATEVFSTNTDPKINLLLYTDDALANNESEADALGINFSINGNNGVDAMDAGKLGNPDENLARLNGGNHLSLENRSMPVDGEMLPLYTSGYSGTDYTFKIKTANLPDNVDAYLYDKYTGNQSLLLEGDNTFSFTVDANAPGSIATDRFKIGFTTGTFGITGNEKMNSLKVYPNPVRDEKLTITSNSLAGQSVNISLYNMLGQLVLSSETDFGSNGEMPLEIGKQSSGIYFLEISSKKGTSKEKLIIK